MSAAQIRRGFLDIAEGQIHFRAAGREPAQSEKPLLVMFHGAPGSSKQFERLVLAMASVRPVMALDTMGMGDSSPSAREDADMSYFADAAGRALDSHGVTGKLDVLGHHEGAPVATEFAIAWPARVNKLILDGMSAAPTERARGYATTLDKRAPIDQVGSQYFDAWHSLRDAYLFRPADQRLAANTLPSGLPSLELFHAHVVEILKGLRTSHTATAAAALYDAPTRLPFISVPTLATCARLDGPFSALDEVARLVPGCTKLIQPQDNTGDLATDEEIRALGKALGDWLG